VYLTKILSSVAQISGHFTPEITSGILFLISEVLRGRADCAGGLTSLLVGDVAASTSSMAKFDEDEDDEDEHYDDVKDEDDKESEVKEEPLAEEEDEVKDEVKSRSASSWLHRSHGRASGRKSLTHYDPQARNPAFAGAQHASLWELIDLTSHVHPTVSLFARTLLDGGKIKYGGDPLQDFTLTRFLDRFVFRNPKKETTEREEKGTKAAKPDAVFSRRQLYAPAGVRKIAPDSKAYADADESSVPLDERFIHRFVVERRARKDADKEEDDNESVTSEDFNDYLDNFYGGKKKRKDGGEEDFDEDDNLDFAGHVDEGANVEEGDDDDDDWADMDDDSDDELQLEGEDDADDQFGELEGSDDEFDEEGFDYGDEEDKLKTSKRTLAFQEKASKGKKRKMGERSGNLEGLLASAEEFADLVEEAAIDDIDLGGSEAVSNLKDKASKKQLKWEAGRHHQEVRQKGSKGANNRKRQRRK